MRNECVEIGRGEEPIAVEQRRGVKRDVGRNQAGCPPALEKQLRDGPHAADSRPFGG